VPAPRPLELADIFRADGEAYRRAHTVPAQQARVMRAIESCRTAEQGGHLSRCDSCAALVFRYHSCGNRHCPKCQTLSRERWVEARQDELLDTHYFHVVFTLPHELNPLAQGNPRLLYGLLFKAASETLQDFGRNPRWLGGEIGITMVLHTWGQNLGQHLHVHCIVTGGALSPEGDRWIPAKPTFLFPRPALSRVFRGKYIDYLRQVFANAKLRFAGSTAELEVPARFERFLTQLRAHDWVVYLKPPFAGPERVVSYLGRYTHRVAISNNRLISFEDGQVRFQWRDYRHGNRCKTMTLRAEELIRRFLLHTLPKGFMRIRHYGVCASRCRGVLLPACRAALEQPAPEPRDPEPADELMLRLTGIDVHQCPHCHVGRLVRIAILEPLSRIHVGGRVIRPP